MRWTKRLKWIRISKIVIPIALAISLVFAGFTVYANEAENFVVRTNEDREIKLSLSKEYDAESKLCLNQTTYLDFDTAGEYTNATFKPNESLLYDPEGNPDHIFTASSIIPDDITLYEGVHSGYNYLDQILFYSFSFYLINNSDRAVDVDMIMKVESVTYKQRSSTEPQNHVDDAIKILLVDETIDVDNPDQRHIRISDNTYTVYSKAETSEENKQHLYDKISYEDRIAPFDEEDPDHYVFRREGDRGYRNMGVGEIKKFTLVLWLEGNDMDCDDYILGEKMKMSIDFKGY